MKTKHVFRVYPKNATSSEDALVIEKTISPKSVLRVMGNLLGKYNASEVALLKSEDK
jgi:hypothetical protein